MVEKEQIRELDRWRKTGGGGGRGRTRGRGGRGSGGGGRRGRRDRWRKMVQVEGKAGRP